MNTTLPRMDDASRLLTTLVFTGTSLDGHRTELRRAAFTKAGVTSINELQRLKHGQVVKVGGLTLAPTTSKQWVWLRGNIHQRQNGLRS